MFLIRMSGEVHIGSVSVFYFADFVIDRPFIIFGDAMVLIGEQLSTSLFCF